MTEISQKQQNKLTELLYGSNYVVQHIYFFFVASPPLKCLSSLFFSSTLFTSRYKDLFTFFKITVTSLCTVLLLIPNLFAVVLTVALFSTMYKPSTTHLSLPDAKYIIYKYLLSYCATDT